MGENFDFSSSIFPSIDVFGILSNLCHDFGPGKDYVWYPLCDSFNGFKINQSSIAAHKEKGERSETKSSTLALT